MVEGQAEGQLLQTTFQTNLTPNTTETLKVVVPTGRGDAVAFAVSFTGQQYSDFFPLFDVQINGKEIQKELLALRYANTPELNGSSQYAKVHVLIPEGATITVTTTSFAFATSGGIVLDLFFTDSFLPLDAPFDFNQHFFLEVPSLSTGVSKQEIIPAKRGHIVGITLSSTSQFSDYTDPTVKGTIEINGTSIIEDYSLVRYSPWQNGLRINNWVTNISPGGTITLSSEGSGALVSMFVECILHFNEDIANMGTIEKRKSGVSLT